MRTPDIVSAAGGEHAYQRGMLLGLTMAELVMLVLFILLLLLASLLGESNQVAREAREEVAALTQRLAETTRQMNALSEALTSVTERFARVGYSQQEIDDFFQELRLAQAMERELTGVRDQLREAEQALVESEHQRADLDQALSQAHAQIKAIEGEIRALAERLELQVPPPEAGHEALLGAVEARIDTLAYLQEAVGDEQEVAQALEAAIAASVEARQQFEQAVQTMIPEAFSDEGLPTPEQAVAYVEGLRQAKAALEQLRQQYDDPQTALEQAQALEQALALNAERLGLEADAGADAVLDALEEELQVRDSRLNNLQGQMVNLRTRLERLGRGGEMPPCWVTLEGRPEYLYNIEMSGAGLLIRENSLPHRARDRARLPLDAIALGSPLSTGRFLAQTEALYRWSLAEECRFFVRVYDRTGAGAKSLYKNLLRTVGGRFYYYEPR